MKNKKGGEDMSCKLKKPLEVNELKELLKVNNLPQFLKGTICYKSNNINDFYIGFNRIAIGDPIATSYKAIVKNLILISKNITMPVKRNGEIVKEWIFDYVPDAVVIILNVKEEFFTVQDLNQVNYNLIGIFRKEEFISELNSEEDYDEFTSFLDEEEGENEYE